MDYGVWEPGQPIRRTATWEQPKGDRHVGSDRFKDGDEHIHVSTVFLVIDHGHLGYGPKWFETMVFGGKYDGECERYATEDEARAGHKEWATKVGAALAEKMVQP